MEEVERAGVTEAKAARLVEVQSSRADADEDGENEEGQSTKKEKKRRFSLELLPLTRKKREEKGNEVVEHLLCAFSGMEE